MTVEQLISQLQRYDRDLVVVIVDEYGEPFQISYCSSQHLDESGEMFIPYLDASENNEAVVSIWPEC